MLHWGKAEKAEINAESNSLVKIPQNFQLQMKQFRNSLRSLHPFLEIYSIKLDYRRYTFFFAPNCKIMIQNAAEKLRN